jgi:glycerophosphoryl diester phosphodiesterase
MRAAWVAGAIALGLVVTAAGGPVRPRVAAHRGGALLWPENSLTAFRGALGLGTDLLELDLHLTRDGEVVVIHDPTLDRTTTGRGTVRDHTWAELAPVTLRETTNERLPRFRDVLDLVGPTPAGLLIEIKVGADGARYPGIEEKVLRLLGETGVLERNGVMVMAFEWDTLERLRALSPALRLTGLLSRHGAERLGGVRAAAERLAALKANDLGIEKTLLTPAAVAAARAAGLTIGVWTVNEPDELRAALAAGVDYVTTDRPDLALALRGQGPQ